MKIPQFSFSAEFWKKLIIVIVVFIGLIIGLNIFLKSKIESQIQKTGQRFSKMEYSDLEVGFLNGKIQLKELIVDWKADSLLGKHNLEKNIGLIAKSAAVDGLSWWDLLFKNNVSIDELKLEEPKVSIFKKNIGDDSFKKLFSNQEKNKGGKEIPLFKIENIKIINGHFQSFVDNMKLIGLDSLQLTVNGLNFDKNNKNHPLKIADLDWSLRNLFYQKIGGLHTLKIGNIAGNKQNNNLIIKELKLIPLASKKQFSKYIEYKEARLDLQVSKISTTEFHWDSLLFSQKLLTDKMTIDRFKFLIFDDKNVPRCKTCYKPFPQEVLLKSNLPISVDSLFVMDGFIEYEHLVPEHTKAGKISFENIQATLININNIPEKIKEIPTTTLFAQTDVEGVGRLDLITDFHLTDNLYRFSYRGDLRNFDLTTINSMVEFSARVSIKHGTVKQLTFEGEGNNKMGRGEMDFVYENLDISLLTEDYQVGKKLLSGLVNGLLIKNNNPGKKGYRKGKMYAERLKNRAIFHLWWQSILSGMKSTMLPKVLLKDELKWEKD